MVQHVVLSLFSIQNSAELFDFLRLLFGSNAVVLWCMFPFFTLQINLRSLGSRCMKETEESFPRVDFSFPLIYYDPSDLGLI